MGQSFLSILSKQLHRVSSFSGGGGDGGGGGVTVTVSESVDEHWHLWIIAIEK